MVQAHALYHLARIELEKLSKAVKDSGIDNMSVLVAMDKLGELDKVIVTEYGKSRMK